MPTDTLPSSSALPTSSGGQAAATIVPTTHGRPASLPGYSEAGLVERALERYEVVRPLGAGGMGEVALVQDHDIERVVAVKYLHTALAAPPHVARFVEEIRTVGALEHPNIVPIHDAGRDEAGRYFFVMKHVQGETLEQIIQKLRARDPAYEARYTHQARVEIFIGVLNALQFAHEKGYVHRDVKPSNVMVGPSGEVVLMDWGLTKSVAAEQRPAPPDDASVSSTTTTTTQRLVKTQLGALLGTPEYMSPEQAERRNDALDARSDLYSAMVLFHELMFLEHYLEGHLSNEPTLEEIVDGVRKVWPRSPWSAYVQFPRAPPPYLHLCFKGMQKDPAERFQSAAEIIAMLRRIQDGTAPIQCRATAMRRVATELGRLADRSPPATMLVMMLMTAMAVTSLLVWGGWLARLLR